MTTFKRPEYWVGIPNNFILAVLEPMDKVEYKTLTEVTFITPEAVAPTPKETKPDGVIWYIEERPCEGSCMATIYVDSFIGWLRRMKELGCEIKI